MILRKVYESEYEEWDSEEDEDGEWEWVWEDDEEENQGEQMQKLLFIVKFGSLVY